MISFRRPAAVGAKGAADAKQYGTEFGGKFADDGRGLCDVFDPYCVAARVERRNRANNLRRDDKAASQDQQRARFGTYIFDRRRGANESSFGMFVGSGNLTMSGLNAGVEHGTTLLWSTPLTRNEKANLLEVKSELRWWDEAWELAEALTPEILSKYGQMRPRRPREDRTTAVKSFASPIRREVEIDPGLSWTKAKHFWIQTLKLYENRGKGAPGNQLDTKRGTRVYFGFSPNLVPPNTVLGNITLQYLGKPPSSRSVRFGDNSMDKVNLPIPGTEGPNSYDHTVVHFEKIGPKTFQVSVGNKSIANIWRKKSKDQGMLSALHGGREFGFYN